MKRHLLLGTVILLGLGGYASDLFADDQEALKAFGTVQKVFQSPRCQNCHIPGDSPLQFDAGIPHAMSVVRGMEKPGDRSTRGKRPGAAGASTCACVRVPATVAAGTTPASPLASKSRCASLSVMYAAGAPPDGRAG